MLFFGQKRKTNKALFLTNMKDGKIKALTNERELLDMSRKLTTEDIKERIFELVGDEYELLSEYVNNKTKFRIKHVVCGCVYEVKWDNFRLGKRCPKCGGTMKLTNEDIKERIFELVGNEYTKMDDTYINAQTKFSIRHTKCNCVYLVRWSDFQAGCRCPKCNQSKGEKFIEDYLTNKGISFATEVRFDDCRHKLPLPFDFGILDDNKRIIFLVEFDGKQHFEPVKAWGGEEKLKLTQLRDKIKDDYCKEHKIPLLRIKYDEQDISKVIEEFIAQNVA